MSDPPATPSAPSLAVKIDSEKAHPLSWQAVVKRAAVVLVTGVAIYLVFPAITEVFASWPRLSSYWAPLVAGPIAYGVFWLRYRKHRSPPQAAVTRTA